MRPDIEMLSGGLKLALFEIFLFLSIIYSIFFQIIFGFEGQYIKEGGIDPLRDLKWGPPEFFLLLPLKTLNYQFINADGVTRVKFISQ